MARIINPLTTARAIVSAHKRWLLVPNGETIGETLTRAMAREGRRDLQQTVQVLKSAKGRLTAASGKKSGDFRQDSLSAVQVEEHKLYTRALAILDPAPQVAPVQAPVANLETQSVVDNV